MNKQTKGKWVVFFAPSVILAACGIYLYFFAEEKVVGLIVACIGSYLYILSKLIKAKGKSEEVKQKEQIEKIHKEDFNLDK